MVEDDAEPPNGSNNDGETFHIYILSFAYGILAVVVIGHLVWRWQWRRRKLAQFHPHVPGDASFKCRAMRQQLRDDFAAVKSVSSDPRLVNPSHQLKNDGASVPIHWYRMKTFDAAADFVASNVSLVEGSDSCSLKELPLPKFLDRLRQSSAGLSRSRPAGHEQLMERCCQLYALARYEDGNFGQEQFEEFKSLVQKIQQSLQLVSRVQSRSPHPSSPTSHPPHQRDPVYHHHPLGGTLSQEPLLQEYGSLDTHTDVGTAQESASRRDSKSKKKPDEIELSPLVSDTDTTYSPSLSPVGERGYSFEGVSGPSKSTAPETQV